MISVRPSSRWLFELCPSSQAHGNRIDAESAAASSGSAGHMLAEPLLRGEKLPLEKALAAWPDADPGDVKKSVERMAEAWVVIADRFPNPQHEVPVESPWTSGTIDLLSVSDGDGLAPARIEIADWKTGRERGDAESQLTAYAVACREQYGMPESGVISAHAVWLAHGEIDSCDFTDAQLDGWIERHERLTGDIGRRWNPGQHCVRCPIQHACETRAEWLRSAAAAMVATPKGGLTRADLARLYPQAKALEAALEHYNEVLRAEVALGPLPLGDGKELVLREQSRSNVNAARAWATVTGHMGNQAWRVASLSLSKITKEAPDLVEKLQAQDLIEKTTYTVLAARKTKEQK